MVNINMLRGKIVEDGLSVADVANAIGVSTASMYRKITNCGETMLVKEAYEIGRLLQLTAEEMKSIFFANIVSKNETKKKDDYLMDQRE